MAISKVTNSFFFFSQTVAASSLSSFLYSLSAPMKQRPLAKHTFSSCASSPCGFLKQQTLPQDGLPAVGPEQLHFCRKITLAAPVSCQTEGCRRPLSRSPAIRRGRVGWEGCCGSSSLVHLHPLPGKAGPPCQGPCPHSLLSEESRFLSLVHVRQNLPATSMDFKHW